MAIIIYNLFIYNSLIECSVHQELCNDLGPLPTQHYHIFASGLCQPETQKCRTIHFFEEYPIHIYLIWFILHRPLACPIGPFLAPCAWGCPGPQWNGIFHTMKLRLEGVFRCTELALVTSGGFRLYLTSSLAGPQVLMVEGGRGGAC